MLPHQEGEPRHNRQWLHAYTSNFTASGDFGTTTDVIDDGLDYANDAAASRRQARMPSITAPHLHRQHCPTEKMSPDVIVHGFITNDTHPMHVVWSS
jgi:hypothetical protein